MANASRAQLDKVRPLTREPHQKATSVVDLLASKLQASIASGEFAVGSPLPTERELMSTFKVSRATVREAIRELSAQNLVKVKRGRSGGSFVANPSPNQVVRSLNQFISGHEFRFVDLVNARDAIEPAAAVQAALERTEEKLEALRLLCIECEQNVDSFETFVDANLRWHLALAEASNNPLFLAFLTSISAALHAATALEEFDIRVRKAVVGVHWQIYDAIRVQDPEAARRRMMRHLNAYGDKLSHRE